MSTSGPLAGLKVIELAHIMAGPVCGLMLADMGSDVIKLEKHPGGDDSRRFLPPDIAGELAKLQDRVPPFPGDVATARIEAALGQPVSRLFRDFDRTPLAAASIAQLNGAARLITRDIALAEDAVQEALTRAWRDLPTLRDPDRYEAWLHRLLVRSCFDELRKTRARRVEVTLTDKHQPVAQGVESGVVDRDELERGFRRLAPEQRAVVVLHFYLGLSLADTAHALGVRPGTARSRLHRAVRTLRAALDADARTPLEALEGGPA